MSRLLQLVENLQTGFTNPEKPLRCDAFLALNQGFQALPLSEFTNKGVAHVVDFYVTNMVYPDPMLVGALLDGLLWLSNAELLTGENAVKICADGFFTNLQIRSLGKTERQKAIQLLHDLLAREQSRQGLLSLKLEFIRGYIASVEEEKDPKCLLHIFDAHCLVIRYANLGPLEEDMFDIMAAYFPVDYAPPPGNPSGITRSNIVEKLNNCLFLSCKFAGSLLLPLLLEKAASQWPNGRSDALSLLADCLLGYKQAALGYSEFRFTQFDDGQKGRGLSLAEVEAYRFAICNLIRDQATQLNQQQHPFEVQCLLAIVHGLASLYVVQPDQQKVEDFVETFLSTVWPTRRDEQILEMPLQSWFAVIPTSGMLPCLAPEGLLADCLLAAVSSGITESPNSLAYVLWPKLLCRLASPMLAPTVDVMPEERILYEAKYSQLITWTPHIGFLNRILATIDNRLRQQGVPFDNLHKLFVNRHMLASLMLNLSRFFEIACARFGLCCPTASDGKPVSKSDRLQARFTESTAFNLLCRLTILIASQQNSDDVNIALEPILVFCRHIILHHACTSEVGRSFSLLRTEQINLLSMLAVCSNPIGSALLEMLFESLADTQSTATKKFILDILQRAACDSEKVLKRLLESVFKNFAMTPNNENAVDDLASVLLTITSALRCGHERLETLLCLLSQKLELFFQYGESRDFLLCTKETLIKLLNAFRLLSAGLCCEGQSRLLNYFGITRKLEMEAIELHLDCLLNVVLESVKTVVFTQPLKRPSNDVLDTLGDELSNAFASLANKVSNQVASDLVNRIVFDVFTISLTNCSPEDNALISQFAAYFVVRGLRALVSLPQSQDGPNLLEPIKRLLDLLFADVSTEGSFWSLRLACLTTKAELLMPPTQINATVRLLDFLSEDLHAKVSVVSAQKCYCLIGLKLRTVWGNCHRSEIALADACLHAYLQMALQLPCDVLVDVITEVLESAVLAITAGTYQLATQTLGLSLISTVAELLPSSLLGGISESQADSLFEKLPQLLNSCNAISRPLQTELEALHDAHLRYHLACCLCVLVGLPASITARHRNRVRRLLEGLLDDDCRAVRLAAAKANNYWCLRV